MYGRFSAISGFTGDSESCLNFCQFILINRCMECCTFFSFLFSGIYHAGHQWVELHSHQEVCGMQAQWATTIQQCNNTTNISYLRGDSINYIKVQWINYLTLKGEPDAQVLICSWIESSGLESFLVVPNKGAPNVVSEVGHVWVLIAIQGMKCSNTFQYYWCCKLNADKCGSSMTGRSFYISRCANLRIAILRHCVIASLLLREYWWYLLNT